MRDFEPIRAGPAQPSFYRMARGLLHALSPASRFARMLLFAAVMCISCGFTAQKTAEEPEVAGTTIEASPATAGTIATVNCYGERRPGRDYRNCPPPRNYRGRRDYRDSRDYVDEKYYREYKEPSNSRLIILTVVIIIAIGLLIYWLAPTPAPADFCIPQAEKTKLVADIAAAFVSARGEATAAKIPEALPLLKLAENGVTAAVNKIKVCPP